MRVIKKKVKIRYDKVMEQSLISIIIFKNFVIKLSNSNIDFILLININNASIYTILSQNIVYLILNNFIIIYTVIILI